MNTHYPVASSFSGTSRFVSFPWFWYGVIVALYAFSFGFWPVQPLPGVVLGANVLLVAVCCFPLTLWKARNERNVPMFEIVCLAYGVQFGVAAQIRPNSLIILSDLIYLDWDTLLHATWLSILGVSAMIAGYEAMKRVFSRRTIFSMDLPLNARRIPYYLVAAPLLSVVALGLQLSSSGGEQWSALVNLLSGQLYLAIILLSYSYFGERRTRLITWLFFLSIVIGGIGGLATGFLEKSVIPLALVVIVRWHLTRRFPWAPIIVMLLVFAVLNSVKQSYRKTEWYGKDTGVTSRILRWGDLATQTAPDLLSGTNQASNTDDASGQLWARFNLIPRFGWVLHQTPSRVPYFDGETYSYLLYGWIPRFIWPDKPTVSEGAAYRIDLSYQLIIPEQVGRTNIGIGFLPEAFANFGTFGVFFVMALQGACFAFLDRLLNGPHSQGGRAIYLAVMIFFLNGIGSSTVTLFGALLQIVIANGLILRYFSTAWSAGTARKLLG